MDVQESNKNLGENNRELIHKGFNMRTVHFNCEQMLKIRDCHVGRGFVIISVWNSGFLGRILKWVIRRNQSTRVGNW